MTNEHSGKCKMRINGGLNHDMTPAKCDCDGYHTFNELYDHRIVLYIALAKAYMRRIEENKGVWRSRLHSDGSVWDDWFIMGIGTKEGEQITYHLPMKMWSFTDFAESLERAPEFDGHSSDDVLARLAKL